MTSTQYCIVSGVLFALVSVAHLLRLVYGLSVHVGAYAVPMAVSWIGFFVPAALALWAFRSTKTSAT